MRMTIQTMDQNDIGLSIRRSEDFGDLEALDFDRGALDLFVSFGPSFIAPKTGSQTMHGRWVGASLRSGTHHASIYLLGKFLGGWGQKLQEVTDRQPADFI